MLHRAGASHLGSSLSIVEMLSSMYESVDCNKIRSGTRDRDRIFVSKGHAAAATYAVMAHSGILPMESLETYHLENSALTGHVNHHVPGVEHSTGALGHGLNVAVGCAYGLKNKYPTHTPKVLVLCGDGEIQEGSVWEGLMFAAHHSLSNLAVLIDDNQISSITSTHEVLDLRPYRTKLEAFGFSSSEVDGHDVAAMKATIESGWKDPRPKALVCRTVKGKGVSFAENQPIWHYRTLNDALLEEAKASLA